MLYAANPQDALIIDIDSVALVQFVSDPSVSHIRMFCMDVSDFLCNSLIAALVVTDRIL